ncbi:MAG: hypothetical protein HY393_01540 [Candidatus Diapherotrites archaeon]|nr:hypothetical protein [Candidatus Diapherotrites archaeon]
MTYIIEEILDTTKYVVDNAKHVSINEHKLNDFSKGFKPHQVDHWISAAPYNLNGLNPEQRFNFLLLLNSINFSYWGEPKWSIQYNNQYFDGAFGMIAALGKAVDARIPVLDFSYLAKMKEAEFSSILEGNTQIPLFGERLTIVRSLGEIVSKKFQNNATVLLKEAQGDTGELLEVLISHFPFFQDTEMYNGRKVHFYKRAQLFIGDVYQAFSEEKWGRLKNIHTLTACADYKIPQVLRQLGILEYSEELTKKVDAKIQLPKGSPEEVEIRAHTIWAVEKIRQALKKKMDIDAIQVDHYLWLLGQDKKGLTRPYHRTRTTAY